MTIAALALAAGLLSYGPAALAQTGAPAARFGRGGVELRYDVSCAGDVVTLSDTRSALVVRVLTTASNAYQMTVKGEDVIRRTWNTLDDMKQFPFAHTLTMTYRRFPPVLPVDGANAIGTFAVVNGRNNFSKTYNAQSRRRTRISTSRSRIPRACRIRREAISRSQPRRQVASFA